MLHHGTVVRRRAKVAESFRRGGHRLVEYSPGQHRDARGRWNAGFGAAFDKDIPAVRMENAVAKWQSTYENCRFMQEHPDTETSLAFAAAVEHSPRTQGAVYRGFDEYKGDIRQPLAKSKAAWEGRIGKRIEMNVPTSATPDIDTAAEFGKVVFEITGGEARDISHLSSNPSFKESVLKPGTFGVVGVRQGPSVPNSLSRFRADTSPTIIVSLAAV